MPSGRDTYATKYLDGVESQTMWLRLTAAPKVETIELLSAGLDVGSIIDIGCGSGAIIIELRRRAIGTHHYAVDYSPEALGALKDQDPAIHAAQTDVTVDPDPFGKGPYDLAIVSHVVEHLEHPEEFLAALLEVPFRHAVIEVPLDDLAISRAKNLLRDRTENAAGHVQFFTPRSFRQLIQDAGLTIEGERIYTPILSREAITFDAPGRLRRGLKLATLRVLPRLFGPLWRRWYYAHHAVLVTGTHRSLAS